MFVCCECCVLSGRGLCDGLITHLEGSYRLWCVVVCDLGTSSRMRRPWPALGCRVIEKRNRCEKAWDRRWQSHAKGKVGGYHLKFKLESAWLNETVY
jgi:hypothetical protein